MRLHPRAHGFAQRLDVGGACRVEIDEEIAVQVGDFRAADLQPAAAGLVDQLPGASAGRVLEGGAAGSVARLAFLALALDRSEERLRLARAL